MTPIHSPTAPSLAQTPVARRTLLGATAASLGSLGLAPLAHAQGDFSALPAGPFRFIVGAPAGGGTDVIARLLAQHLQAETGKNFLIENKPGANGIIAADFVSKSAPDGTTIGIGISSHQLVNQLLYTKLPLNYRTDLARLYKVADTGTFLTINPQKTKVKTLQELVAYIKANKGKLSYGSYGLGSYPHLAGERLNQLTQGDMAHVPYKGEAPMMQALMGGELDIGWVTVNGLKQHTDRLLALATIGTERVPALPNVPTFAQGGISDEAFSILGWVGTSLPAKTPDAVKNALGAALARVMAKPEVQQRFIDMGYIGLKGGSPQAFEAFYANDFAKWEKLINLVGVKLD